MNLLYYIVVMSLTGSLVFVFFKVTEQIAKHYISATWHYNVLKCVTLFFIIPIGKLDALFIHRSFPGLHNGLKMGIIMEYAVKMSKYTVADHTVNFVILSIWFLGIAIILLRQAFCFIRFRYITFCNKMPADITQQWLAELCAAKLGIRKRVHLYVNENINTPMLIGFFSPIILIPSKDLELANLEYIIGHELTHYKNKDLIVKFIILFLRAIHWFNPFIYLLSRDLEKWCEYSCDERNAINLSMEKKKEYGLAILDAAAIMPIYGSNFGTPFLLPKQNLKERLMYMLNVRKMSKRSVLCAVALTVLLISGGCVTAITGEVNHARIKQETADVIVNVVNLSSSNDIISNEASINEREKIYGDKWN